MAYNLSYNKNIDHSLLEVTPINNKNTHILYHYLHTAYKYCKANPIQVNITPVDVQKLTRQIQSQGASYFPLVIKSELIRTMKYKISFCFKYKKRVVNVNFYEKQKPNVGVFSKKVRMICMWFYIMTAYTKSKFAENLTIDLYMSDHKKILPKKGDIISYINVNSGFSLLSAMNGHIVIYRREEWFKVLIHECFHALGLDFSTLNGDLLNDLNHSLNKSFSIDTQLRIYESYTEFWAEIMNVAFVAFDTLHDKQNARLFGLYWEGYMYIEKVHSLTMMVKILDFLGFSYEDFCNPKMHAKIRKRFKQKTHVLEYFILKGILMNDYNGFITFCRENNKELLNFNKSQRNLKRFGNYITCKKCSENLLYNLNIMEDIIKTKKNKTMRMSINELQF
jgi:hypothetical protein